MVVYLVVATVLTLQQIPQMNIFGFSIGTGLAYVQRRKMSPAPVLFSSTSPGTKVSLSLSLSLIQHSVKSMASHFVKYYHQVS